MALVTTKDHIVLADLSPRAMYRYGGLLGYSSGQGEMIPVDYR